MIKAHFQEFAAYNAWANARLYAAAGALPDADLRRDLGAAFGSVFRTLNHVLVADVIWTARFRGVRPPAWGLDHIAHDSFEDLRAARVSQDEHIIRCVEGLTEADLAAEFTYTPVTTPDPVTQPLAPALAHVFNHQTHHRGQAHALLTRLTGEAPPLDLVCFQRERAA